MTKGHVETAKLASAVLEVHKPRQAEWTGWLRAQMALITMARLKRDDPSMSDDAASKETAKTIFCRKELARDVWNKAVEAGVHDVINCLDSYSEREDGRKGQNSKRSVPPERYAELDDLIQKFIVQQDMYLTGSNTVDVVQDHFGISISERTGRRILERLGYKWGKLVQTYEMTPARKMRIAKFMVEYADALRKEAAGTHVIV